MSTEEKKEGKRVIAGKESEELQAKGWTVNHSVVEAGIKVHYLAEPETEKPAKTTKPVKE